VDISLLPTQFQNGFSAIAIGGAHNTKKLPPEKLIELCSEINSPIILLGGKEDSENGQIIEKSNPDKKINACGKYSINQSASILKQAQKVYTHDTGMMHIAAAFKKDITSIWGNTIPEFGMYPYYGKDNSLKYQRINNKIYEVQNLYCRPCSKIGYEKCPEGHFKCMREMNFEDPKMLSNI
jgi:ADP-heptose:LPS heptosyltransferase